MATSDSIEKETTFTPGPWTIEGPDQFGDYNIHHPADRLAIGVVVSNMRPAGEVAANARISAAATELYEALISARSRIEYLRDPSINGAWNDALKRTIDAALAKARGEDRSHEGK